MGTQGWAAEADSSEMTEKIWFSAGGERIRATLDDAFTWCERCFIVTSAPTAGTGHDSFWSEVERHADRVHALALSQLESGDRELLGPFQASGVLRRFTDGEPPRGHAIWFERNGAL